MSEPTLSAQVGKLFGYLRGLHATHHLDLGVRLGLFEALARGPCTPEALAAALGLHAPYVRSFCETGFHLEVLEREEGVYRLAPHMERLLATPEDTFYVGGFPRVHLTVAQDYERYPDCFRSGSTHPYQAHGREFLADVAGATRALARMFLDAAESKLPELVARLDEGGRLLDVGCGAGHALLTFASRFPRCTGVGIEIEPVSAEMARTNVRDRGLEDRLEIRTQWEEADREAYDLVTQFLVLHEIRPELKPEVIGRCSQALKPGGLLLLFDECYPEDDATARHPIQGFAVVAQWFELVWGNVINTRSEIQELLLGAGLQPADEMELSRFRIIIARKPGPGR